MRSSNGKITTNIPAHNTPTSDAPTRQTRQTPFPAGPHTSWPQPLVSPAPRVRRRRFKAAHPEGQLTTASAFLSGGLAGAVAALLTTPLDVLKTRRQVESRQAEGGLRNVGGGPGTAWGTAGTLTRIARAEGGLALFAGVVPRLAKVAPSCAIMIASYEMGKQYFTSPPPRHGGL